ncbi:MAG TPA: PA2779 family protein [Thermoanaerobaculia bacterium]|nr:PA2779 family protein [Thermoanaerobaculia bacterium]
MRNRKGLLIVGLALLLTSIPVLAGPVPSKTAVDQTVTAREADLATVRGIIEIEAVAGALEAQGFDKAAVETRLAQLSDEDLNSLAQNIDQIQAAGLTTEQWTYVGLGVLIVLLLLVI